MNPNIIMDVVGIAMLAFGGYKIWQVVQLSQKIAASKTWPVIAGEVASKKVKEHWTQKSGKSYHPEITVKYAIMGQEYEKTISLPGIFNQNSAERALGEIGPTIDVRYNPQNPAETITGQDKISVMDILVVIFCLAAAIIIMIPSIF